MSHALHRSLRPLLLLASLAGGAAWAQDVELYDQPRFNGTRLTLSADTPDLAAYGLGGRIASVVVRQGQWEFCTQPQYRGACVTVGPGRYAELPPALRGTLASMRNARAAAGAPAAPAAPAAPPPIVPPVAGVAALTLFENVDFSGSRLPLSDAAPKLSQQAFNDVAAAVEITRGRWQLCEHADFNGECTVYGPGRHVLGGKLRNGVSSLRPAGGADVRTYGVRGGLILFEHGGFQGREVAINESVANLGALNFNDKTSSVEVLSGRWELCSDADFGGRCVTLGPGRHQLEKALNDRVSSVRPR